jgi:Putative DNA-binding domain
MSLWHKPVSEITFADVDAFCRTMQPEGMRLDYKTERPNDLARLIAAFANTLGGLIILGVEADKTMNQPVWPPKKGMRTAPGIDEAITAIARDAIYPPVRVGISPIVENVLLPGHSLAVVRVDESRDAPHAVDDARKVYERTGNSNKPYDFARIDRIKLLLDRRSEIEAKRESLIKSGLTKLNRELEKAPNPKGWVCVSPIYPWRDLCRPSECYEYLCEVSSKFGSPQNTVRDVQRVPDGAFMRLKSRFWNRNVLPTDAILLRSNGLFIYMRPLLSLDRQSDFGVQMLGIELSDKLFDLTSFWQIIASMFDYAREFYTRPNVELPGLVSLELGLDWVRGTRLHHQGTGGRPYEEDDYRDSATTPASDFIQPGQGLETMRKRLIFGFDFETPEGM